MRPLLLLLLALSLTSAELEQITLADGRRLIGYYDEAAGRLTVEGPPKAVLPITARQIVSRSPYVRAVETDPVKRDEAELVRLESEHAAAIADASRLRKFASTRTGKDAETAIAQADERVTQATRLAEKIDAARARLATSKPAPSPEQASARPAPAKADSAQSALIKAREEARRLREQATALEFNAVVAWLQASDLTPLAPPILGEDPRQSEIDARDKAQGESRRRARMAKLLKESESITEPEQRDEWVKDVMSIVSRR